MSQGMEGSGRMTIPFGGWDLLEGRKGKEGRGQDCRFGRMKGVWVLEYYFLKREGVRTCERKKVYGGFGERLTFS